MAQMKVEGKDNTEEYKKLAAATGNLANTIQDTRAEVKFLANDFKGVAAVSGILGGIADAAQLLEGTMVSLGIGEKERIISIVV